MGDCLALGQPSYLSFFSVYYIPPKVTPENISLADRMTRQVFRLRGGGGGTLNRSTIKLIVLVMKKSRPCFLFSFCLQTPSKVFHTAIPHNTDRTTHLVGRDCM